MTGPLQTTVQRAYTTGFAGQVVRTGPVRAKPARILSATLGGDGYSTNRMSRVFGYNSDISVPGGSTVAADADSVVVGGTNFYGVLGNPQHHVLYGSSGNSLAPSMDLPQGAEGEFFDMVPGIVAEVFNPGGGVQAVAPGDILAYVPVGISGANNPDSIPLGGLVWVAKGGAAPTGMLLVPNAKIITVGSIAASGVGSPASTLVIVQM